MDYDSKKFDIANLVNNDKPKGDWPLIEIIGSFMWLSKQTRHRTPVTQ